MHQRLPNLDGSAIHRSNLTTRIHAVALIIVRHSRAKYTVRAFLSASGHPSQAGPLVESQTKTNLRDVHSIRANYLASHRFDDVLAL